MDSREHLRSQGVSSETRNTQPAAPTEVRGEKSLDQASKEQSTQQASSHAKISTTNEPKDPAFLVKWDENDPKNPLNYSNLYKIWLTFLLGMLAMVGAFGSSVVSPASAALSADLGLTTELTSFAIGLYLLGFAVGPCLWAPLGEVYGRKVSMLPALIVFVLFSIGSALSTTGPALLVTRFFAGVFGSAPISNVAATLGDIYEAKTRGLAVTFYTVCVSGGPCISPVIGAAVTVNPHLGWRWTQWITAILAGVMLIAGTIFLPETYHPVLLKAKAAQLRKETGDNRYWHPHETQKITPRNVVTKYLARPLRMLVTEPICTALCLYASFVYGLVYLLFVAVPVVFQRERGWSLVSSTLPFVGGFIGVLFALTVNIGNNPRYAKAVKQNKGRAVPEARLPPLILGGIVMAGALFWFGWTAAANYNWLLPVVGLLLIVFSMNIIFQQCVNFLIDAYGQHAASAAAANTILRALLGFALPVVGGPMIDNLGVPVACSVLGAIACLAIPVPFVLMKYHLKLRKMSKFASLPED